MRTIPWEWYASPDVLRAEEERILGGAWVYAGPSEWVAGRGDQLPCRAGGVPLVVVREAAGELRAFLNVCRHRGAEVVVARTRRETLQCPYHGWTYGLDGRLRAAPRSDPADLDVTAIALAPARVEEWGPFVFVNADPDALPLSEALGEVPRLLEQGGVDVSALAFRERSETVLAANWKIAVENYLECYHCPVAHPGFSGLVDVSPEAYVLEPAERRWSQYGQARDGGGACQFHLVWPTLKINVYPGFPNLSLGSVWPEGPERTAGFLDYYFGPGVDDARAAELIAFDEQVGREDARLVESVQRGVRAGRIDSGVLVGEAERLVAGFQQVVRDSLDGATL